MPEAIIATTLLIGVIVCVTRLLHCVFTSFE